MNREIATKQTNIKSGIWKELIIGQSELSKVGTFA